MNDVEEPSVRGQTRIRTGRRARVAAGIAIALLLASCASQEEKANRHFVAATELWSDGTAASHTSYTAAAALYEEAVEKVEQITSKYPSTPIAVRIAEGGVDVGGHPLTELRTKVLPAAQYRARLEQDPLKASLAVAAKIPLSLDTEGFLAIDEPWAARAAALLDLAETYARLEKVESAEEVLAKLEGDLDEVDDLIQQWLERASIGARSDYEVTMLRTNFHFRYAEHARFMAKGAALYAQFGNARMARAMFSPVLVRFRVFGPTAPFNSAALDVHLAILAGAYRRGGLVDDVLELAGKATPEFRDALYASAARLHADSARIEDAEEILARIEDAALRADVLSRIARADARAGRLEKARARVDEAKSELGNADNSRELRVTAAELAIVKAEITLGDQAIAKEILARLNAEARSSTLRGLHDDQPSWMSEEELEELIEESLDDVGVAERAALLALLSRCTEARAVAAQVADDEASVVAGDLVRYGCDENLRELLDRARTELLDDSGDYWTAVGLLELGDRYAQAGEKDGTWRCWLDALEVESESRHERLRNLSFAAAKIGETYATNGEGIERHRIMNRILREGGI